MGAAGVWPAIKAWLASLKGWRTLIVGRALTFIGIVAGVAVQLDWVPIVHDNFPSLPRWADPILAGVLIEYMRRITTTPMGKRE